MVDRKEDRISRCQIVGHGQEEWYADKRQVGGLTDTVLGAVGQEEW